MRVLVIGGTRFTGPRTVQRLLENGHDVTLFHRGKTHDDRVKGTLQILGDRADLQKYRDKFKSLGPDVVLDMIPFREEEAANLMKVFDGIAPRVVALSSCDVYLAFGILWKAEDAPIQPTPLKETDALRTKIEPTGEKYNKRAVERHVMNHPHIAGTILRLPALHGPNDGQHRLFRYIKRMDDGRPAIILDEEQAAWRWSRSYVDNVSEAIYLAVANEKASGEIYNVAEPTTYTETKWIEKIAESVGWSGKIAVLKKEQLPPHLDHNYEFRQHVEIDSSKIRTELGFREVVSEDEALRRTIEWERANPPKTIKPEDYDYAAEDEALTQIGTSDRQ